jgi:hypothetical protein
MDVMSVPGLFDRQRPHLDYGSQDPRLISNGVLALADTRRQREHPDNSQGQTRRGAVMSRGGRINSNHFSTLAIGFVLDGRTKQFDGRGPGPHDHARRRLLDYPVPLPIHPAGRYNLNFCGECPRL